jgi:hypothetical protein
MTILIAMAGTAATMTATAAYLVRLARQPAPPPTSREWDLEPEGTA